MVKTEETRTRSIVKAITWRIFASISTLILAYLITGNLVFAGLISLLDVVIKFIEYFLHERIWSFIPWGYQRTEYFTPTEDEGASESKPI